MSDTPRTDATYAAAYRPRQVVSPVNQMRDFARQLERELSAAPDLLEALEVAADALYNPFEPDNQSRAYITARAAIAKATDSNKSPHTQNAKPA